MAIRQAWGVRAFAQRLVGTLFACGLGQLGLAVRVNCFALALDILN